MATNKAAELYDMSGNLISGGAGGINTAGTASTEKTPYDLIEEAYQASLGLTEKKRQVSENAKKQNEKRLSENLTEQNRAAGIEYNNLINPFGANAEQRGVMGTGVSDYIRNAAYGQLLQGKAQNQRTYEDSYNTIQSDFQTYLLELAGLDTDALNTRNTATEEQKRYDAEQAAAAAAAAEQKRQFDLTYAAAQAAAAQAASSSGGSSGLTLDSDNSQGLKTKSGASLSGLNATQRGQALNYSARASRTKSKSNSSSNYASSVYGSYTAPKYVPRVR